MLTAGELHHAKTSWLKRERRRVNNVLASCRARDQNEVGLHRVLPQSLEPYLAQLVAEIARRYAERRKDA